jgi:hypothetical protein
LTLGVRVNPVPADFALATVSNTLVTFNTNKLILLASDAGVTLSITGVSGTSTNGGIVSLNGTTITYTPVADFVGADAFTYTLADNVGGSVTGTVNVRVKAINAGSIISLLDVTSDPGHVILTASGIPNTTYKVQASDDLTTWLQIGTAGTASNGVLIYTDTNPNYPSRYYRLAQ